MKDLRSFLLLWQSKFLKQKFLPTWHLRGKENLNTKQGLSGRSNFDIINDNNPSADNISVILSRLKELFLLVCYGLNDRQDRRHTNQ